MSRLRLLIGLALASMLDMSAGIIIAHALCKLFSVSPSMLIYGSAALIALAPDISILGQLISGKKSLNSHHRELTHYPLLIIPVFAMIAWFSLFWAALVGLCLLAHFLDDTADPGGVKWLAPFTQRSFQILTVERGPLKLKDWLERYYLRPTVKSLGSIVLSTIAAWLLISHLWPVASS